MFKIAGSVIDCYDDPKFMASFEAHKYMGKELLPPEALDKLADNQFALKITGSGPSVRRYPVYNPWITKVSCAYFLDKKDTLPEELVKAASSGLVKACKRHQLGVPTGLDTGSVDSITVNLKKTAAYPTIKVDDELAKALAKKAEAMLYKLSPVDRVLLANELSKVAAAQYSDALSEYVVGGYNPRLDKEIRERVILIKSANDQSASYLAAVAERLLADKDKMHPLEFAIALSDIDKQAGLKDRYKKGAGGGIKDAFSATLGGKSKEVPIEHGQPVGSAPESHGEPVTKEAAEKMTVLEHLTYLAGTYPRNSSEFVKAASWPVPTEYGNRYASAWKAYFKS